MKYSTIINNQLKNIKLDKTCPIVHNESKVREDYTMKFSHTKYMTEHIGIESSMIKVI